MLPKCYPCIEFQIVAAILRGCRYDPVPYWHNDIDRLILIRDLRREEAGLGEVQRLEWVDSCKDVADIINEKRAECWKEFASGLRNSMASGKAASAIKAIGREARSSNSIAIVSSNGKILSKDTRESKSIRRRQKVEVSNYCSSEQENVQSSNNLCLSSSDTQQNVGSQLLFQ